MNIFEKNESNVRSYCRQFPEIFHKAKGSMIYTKEGKEFIDFFAGAGALNYGHNDENIKKDILSYIENDGISHGLDFHTYAKEVFIEKFSSIVLERRNMEYKIQFCGPTGTNAVEAALKLARKIKKRSGIFSFMGGFHGMSLGSLAVTSNIFNRGSAGVSLDNVTFIPYERSEWSNFDCIKYLETIIQDDHSGIEKPAAIILESIQAEGGVNVSSIDWLKALNDFCNKNDILLICDDIQVGCGRTGNFFSFERAGIEPDMIILSKSISGYGLPMSLLLIKPELDCWAPAEHTGTFRGNQLAFVAATSALNYWSEQGSFEKKIQKKESYLNHFLNNQIAAMDPRIKIRGLGMIWGIDLSFFEESRIKSIVTNCFTSGLIIERSGRKDSVLKLIPPLTIEDDLLEKGCKIIAECVQYEIKKERC